MGFAFLLLVPAITTYDEDGRLSKRSRTPEHLNTMKYIEKYLTPDSRILEIGAGTGRYSIALAEMGFDVTSVELVPHNITVNTVPLTAHKPSKQSSVNCIWSKNTTTAVMVVFLYDYIDCKAKYLCSSSS